MEPSYNALMMSNLRDLAKDRSLRRYSRLRKADLISLLRLHDASARASTEYPTITEEGAHKQFDPEESDSEE